LFYAQDGGLTKIYYNGLDRIETTSTGIDVTGTVTATGGDIKATGSLRNQMLVLERTDAANDYKWQIEGGSSGDSQYLAIVDNKGGGAAERLRIDSSGNVGIGTSSPSAKLEVAETDSVAYSSSAIQGDLVVSRKNSAGTVNQVVGLQFDVTGYVGSTTGVAGISAIQTSSASSAALAFQTRNSGTIAERMRISSGGVVSIANNAPKTWSSNSQAVLQIGNTGALELYDTVDDPFSLLSNLYRGTDNSYKYIENNEAARISFYEGDINFATAPVGTADTNATITSRLFIQNEGNVGIGTTSPSSTLEVSKSDQTNGATLTITNAFSGGSWAVNDVIGTIDFKSDDASSSQLVRGQIQSVTDNVTGTNWSYGTALTFSTAFNNTLSEAMRIDSSGNLLVGTTTGAGQYNGTGNNGMAVNSAGQAGQYVTIQNETDSNLYLTKKTGYTDNRVLAFAVAGSNVGTVTVTASATAYNTSSDHRLKENVVDLTGATARIKQLEPKRFNFIADADTTVDGFLAHEVQTVVPEAITGTHNEVDADGNPVYQGIDQSKLVPLLVATIKELEARITALEGE
jgi:hypothetical protein